MYYSRELSIYSRITHQQKSSALRLDAQVSRPAKQYRHRRTNAPAAAQHGHHRCCGAVEAKRQIAAEGHMVMISVPLMDPRMAKRIKTC